MDEEEEKEVNRKTWRIMGIILFVLVVGVASYYIWFQRQQMKEMEELYKIEIERLSDEAEEINLQYEGEIIRVSNDSLIAQLNTERAKTQRVLEELRTVKSTNARRINELTREVETQRKVLRSYVIQIDSLNAENENLKKKNEQVTQQYRQASSQVARLTIEKNQLTATVQTASILKAANIQVTAINAKGRAVKIDKATQLKLTFIISQNNTAPVGEQTVYVCLKKPDDDILTKPNSGNFRFENQDVIYSMKKDIEYDGEEQSIIMYWNIEEYLSPGAYFADIFIAGYRVGSKKFVLER